MIKIKKAAIALCLILVIGLLGKLIIHHKYIKLEYYLVTYQWDKAVSLIDNLLVQSKSTQTRDSLIIIRANIHAAKYYVAQQMAVCSYPGLTHLDKQVYVKYNDISNNIRKQWIAQKEEFLYAARKNSKVKIFLRRELFSGWFEWQPEYKTLADADKFFNRAVSSEFADLMVSVPKIPLGLVYYGLLIGTYTEEHFNEVKNIFESMGEGWIEETWSQ